MLSLWLLALHMLGDYVLQNDWMAANKFKSAYVRTVHVGCYCAPFAIFAYMVAPLTVRHHLVVRSEWAFSWNTTSHDNAWLFSGLLFITHWITDCRRWASGEKWCAKPIMVDQTIHILTLAILAQLFLVGN